MCQPVNWFVNSFGRSGKIHIVDFNVEIQQSRSVRIRDINGRNITGIQMFFISVVDTGKPCIFVSWLKCAVEGRTRGEEEEEIKGN
jgi:hypothetical protein